VTAPPPRPGVVRPLGPPTSAAEPTEAATLPPPPVWPPGDATIVADAVAKSFGALVAVSDVTFAVTPGVTALLGPNGAGKSTLLRVLCGLTPPSRGRVWLVGGDPRRDAGVRDRIGLVPQQDGVFERCSALETVRLAAVLHGLDQPDDAARAALARVELDPEMGRGVGTYSKGMRQRVKIAQALVHDPPVLLLDEPLNGLDPKQRRLLIGLFHQLGDEGRTVVVSSHVLDEVERFGSRVLVIAKGRLAAEGDFRAIRALMDDQPVRVRVRAHPVRPLAADLIATGIASGVSLTGDDALEALTADAPRFRRELAPLCARHDIRLDEVAPLDDDLESVFRYLVGPRP
jgi:ABC-2 type transport system ATP-binding protein